MTLNLVDIVDQIHPAASGIGVIVTDQIWVVFDRELDESSLSNGNFFIAGPDFDTWSGPDLEIYLDAPSLGSEEEILQSPGYHGLLKGTITFERLSLDDDTVISGIDVVGSGLLYRTKAIFTPTERLAPDTEYTVYLSGDEDDTDELSTGVFSRTVFDTVSDPGNTSTGEVVFSGGYLGLLSSDVYHVTISTTGDLSTARFTFYRESDPSYIVGPLRVAARGVPLSDGVTATFTDGIYYSGDEWTVIVKEPNIFLGNFTWPFKTGSGSIAEIPDTMSTSVIATTVGGTAVPASTVTEFLVTNTRPKDMDTSLPLQAYNDIYPLTVTFNLPVDPSTIVVGSTLDVSIEPSAGLSTETTYPGEVAYGTPSITFTTSSNTLTIYVPSGVLATNNLVSVTLGADIASTTGLTLGTDYDFYFTTTYDPLYCSVRRLRLNAGQYLTDVPDDALNLALHMASLESDQRTWNKANLEDNFYHFVRSEWTCCRAAEIILSNTIGGPGRPKSKKLGDLEVEWDTSPQNIKIPLDRIQQCLDKWEKELAAGGRQVQKPAYGVKGELDIDRPAIGRSWLHTRDWLNTQTPAANMRIRPSISRRWRQVYGHRGWWER